MPKIKPATKIVAFLQNQWFRDPERVKSIIAETTKREADRRTADEIREWYIACFLFMGCLTGRRLRSSLGEELTSLIVWEECSREIGGYSASAFPSDLNHMRDVLNRHNPDAVVAYGKIASDALQIISNERKSLRVIYAPHPAARHGSVMSDLIRVKRALGYA